MTSTTRYTDPTPITPEAVILTLWTLEANGDLTARQREIILRMLKDAYGCGKKFLMTPQETRAVRQAFSDYLGSDTTPQSDDCSCDATEDAEKPTAGYTVQEMSRRLDKAVEVFNETSRKIAEVPVYDVSKDSASAYVTEDCGKIPHITVPTTGFYIPVKL